MALKNNWVDKVDGEDIVQAADINEIANAVIELEGALGRDTIIWQINQDYSAVALGDVVTTTDSSLTTISGKTPNVNDYVIDNAGNILRVHSVTAGGGLVLEMVSLAAIDKRNITLGLHTDGLIYIFIDGVPTGNGIALPSGASGDVVGNVDSENNIVLLGNLADGTYTVKYEMEDGSTVDIGDLVLDSTPEEPEETNYFNKDTASLNYRIGSSGSISAYDGMVVTDFIPWDDAMAGKVFKISGMAACVSTKYSYCVRVGYYGSNKAYVTGQNIATAVGFEAGITTTFGDNTGGSGTFMRIALVVKDNVAITMDDISNIKLTLT